jgi:hypothetical protein
MNAVEHIVECYFRQCKGCFTITDVKIQAGNNRQCDLLAYDLINKKQYHVESSVTHSKKWMPDMEQLRGIFDGKFRGTPPKREGKKTDHTRGKSYFECIVQAYRNVGFEPTKVSRVFVTWTVSDIDALARLLNEYQGEHGIKIEVMSLRDEILPKLLEKVSTSNYEDEILRTFSLLRQRDLQTKGG